eukprot:TRINITY_DN3527_c0_g2_i2.p1 TRINITY_DN3527_c0_g2~~TRINITY_DN3527_c0_g2_i2.p1  ORF type:complete len:247 (-),score=66.27 TRINITY_DN3527_c0_g2_i2:87-827(-)
MATVTVSELFREYERDFERLQTTIDDELEFLSNGAADSEQGGSSGSSCIKKVAIGRADKASKEAESALRQMEMEAKTLPTEARSAVQPTMRQYRAALTERKSQLEAARQNVERQSLLGATCYGASEQERSRALDANAKLHNASRQLELAKQQSMESEEIGMDVMSDLRQQRDAISRSRNNMGVIGNNYGRAKSLIETMQQRANVNKMLTKGVALFMCCMVGVTLWLVMGGGLGGASAAGADDKGDG